MGYIYKKKYFQLCHFRLGVPGFRKSSKVCFCFFSMLEDGRICIKLAACFELLSALNAGSHLCSENKKQKNCC